ncbi:hypothetical protein T484DRAFT_1930094 [Baffinella frigidus]|nr:hypothetical protein T484DRAFT_1930094 [Cryptophyta sp. CCMP2293]
MAHRCQHRRLSYFRSECRRLNCPNFSRDVTPCDSRCPSIGVQHMVLPSSQDPRFAYGNKSGERTDMDAVSAPPRTRLISAQTRLSLAISPPFQLQCWIRAPTCTSCFSDSLCQQSRMCASRSFSVYLSLSHTHSLSRGYEGHSLLEYMAGDDTAVPARFHPRAGLCRPLQTLILCKYAFGLRNCTRTCARQSRTCAATSSTLVPPSQHHLVYRLSAHKCQAGSYALP